MPPSGGLRRERQATQGRQKGSALAADLCPHSPEFLAALGSGCRLGSLGLT